MIKQRDGITSCLTNNVTRLMLDLSFQMWNILLSVNKYISKPNGITHMPAQYCHLDPCTSLIRSIRIQEESFLVYLTSSQPGAISLTNFHTQFEFDGSLYFCYSIPSHGIATNLCTCHDSIAVLSSTHSCSNHFISMQMRTNWNIYHISIV